MRVTSPRPKFRTPGLSSSSSLGIRLFRTSPPPPRRSTRAVRFTGVEVRPRAILAHDTFLGYPSAVQPTSIPRNRLARGEVCVSPQMQLGNANRILNVRAHAAGDHYGLKLINKSGHGRSWFSESLYWSVSNLLPLPSCPTWREP